MLLAAPGGAERRKWRAQLQQAGGQHGEKSILDYAGYANQHVYDLSIPDYGAKGARVFVARQREPFLMNLGETAWRASW